MDIGNDDPEWPLVIVSNGWISRSEHKHFAWSDDFTLLIGLTPTGRATVGALLLNRDGVVNLRRLLYLNGEHPPKTPAAD